MLNQRFKKSTSQTHTTEKIDSGAPVNVGETEHFLKDVFQTNQQSSPSEKNVHKSKTPMSFVVGFVLGFILLCMMLFFVYTTIYYVKHELLQEASCITHGR